MLQIFKYCQKINTNFRQGVGKHREQRERKAVQREAERGAVKGPCGHWASTSVPSPLRASQQMPVMGCSPFRQGFLALKCSPGLPWAGVSSLPKRSSFGHFCDGCTSAAQLRRAKACTSEQGLQMSHSSFRNMLLSHFIPSLKTASQ